MLDKIKSVFDGFLVLALVVLVVWVVFAIGLLNCVLFLVGAVAFFVLLGILGALAQ